MAAAAGGMPNLNPNPSPNPNPNPSTMASAAGGMPYARAEGGRTSPLSTWVGVGVGVTGYG